jgi:hypothetical protein
MKLPKISPGDVFQANHSDGRFVYLQYIFQDPDYLGGHLIRSFDIYSSSPEPPELGSLVKSKILFFAYTRITEGVRDGIWSRIGNYPIEKDFEPPLFRFTTDVFSRVKKSDQWRVLRAGSSKWRFIGTLSPEYRRLPIASVLPPKAIVNWIETGSSGFQDPE